MYNTKYHYEKGHANYVLLHTIHLSNKKLRTMEIATSKKETHDISNSVGAKCLKWCFNDLRTQSICIA